MSRDAIYRRAFRAYLRPVIEFLDDPTVSELVFNGHDQIFIERQGKLLKTTCRFPSERALQAAVNNMAEYVGRPLNRDTLTVDGRLPDSSRFSVMMPPASRSGICVTIRKFHLTHLTLDDLLSQDSLEKPAYDILRKAVAEHDNGVISGATGVGKSALLQAIANDFADDERIIVIEDTTELKINKPHVVQWQAIPKATAEYPAVSQRELLAQALRARPDRIILGEARRGEALDIVQAMSCGHNGSWTTIHASSPDTAASRLETLCLQGDTQLPIYVARAQIAAAITIFVQVLRQNGRRFVSQIARLSPRLSEKNDFVWEQVYRKTPA